MSPHHILRTILIGLLTVPAAASFAQDGFSQPAAMAERLDALEAELSALKRQLHADQPPGPQPASHAEMLLPPPPQVFAAELSATPPLVSAPPPAEKPKYPTVMVNGFFQADSLWFDQDEANRETLAFYDPPDSGQPAGDLQDGAGFRRTRLSAKGAVAPQVNYIIQMDFGFFGRPTFTDVYGEFTNVPVLGNVRVGQWKHPFDLETATSVRYQTFLERSLLFQAFTPFRHIGVGFYNNSDDLNWTWAMSALRTGQDQFGNDLGDSGGMGTSGRLTHLAWYRDEGQRLEYLHLGGGYWFADPANDRFRFATIPEAFIGAFGVPADAAVGSSLTTVPGIAHGTPPFVNTGLLHVNTFTNLGAELLWVDGAISVQSQVQMANVALVGDGLVQFWGFTSTLSYFLTGESRPYDRKFGVLERVIPKRPVLTDSCGCHGPGAWEVGLRISHIDLDDGPIRGGRLTDLTAGLNWYLNGYTKVQFNYVRAMLNRQPFGPSAADIFGVRTQVDF